MDRAKGRAALAAKIGAPFAAGTVLLSASLANFLNRNDYGFFRADVLLVLGLFMAVSAAVTLLYSGQRQWGRSLLEGLLAGIFIDLNSTENLVAVGVGVAVAGYTYWKRSSLLGPITIIGCIVLLTTMVGLQGRWSWIRSVPGQQKAAPAKPPPAFLHIILDEHLGLEGFPMLGPDGIELRDKLKSDYMNAGFTIYGRAYSEHMHTVNAIPQVLNYDRRLGLDHSSTGVKIGPTEHLQALAKSGYSLKIFQSDFADICSGISYANCTTYDSFSLRPLLATPLTVTERSRLIILKFLKLSDFSFSLFENWNATARLARRSNLDLPTVNITSSGLTSSVATFAALDELNSQLSNARPGDAYIVHLLMPHYPYVMSRDCQPLPKKSWDWRISKSPLAQKQHAYMEQVRCVTTKVLKAVDVFGSSPGGKNGAVLIHGDHGSRLTRTDPHVASVGKFTDADLIAGFSTFFAVRTPDRRSGYVDGAQPITPLVRDFARQRFASMPRLDPKNLRGVYLDDSNWRPRIRVPMPAFWVKPSSAEPGQKKAQDFLLVNPN